MQNSDDLASSVYQNVLAMDPIFGSNSNLLIINTTALQKSSQLKISRPGSNAHTCSNDTTYINDNALSHPNVFKE